MAIYKITKKEFDQIKHDQQWGIHEALLFEFDGHRYKCNTIGAAGINEINRFQIAKRKLKRDQLDLLGFPDSV